MIFSIIYSGKSVGYSYYFSAYVAVGVVNTSSKGTDCKVNEFSDAGTSVTFFNPV